MKNLKLRTKLNFLGTSIFLFILFDVVYTAFALSRAAGEPVRTLAGQLLPLLVVSACYLLFVFLFLSGILRGSVEPLHAIGGAMEKISGGDLGHEADHTMLGLQEEFGDLARSVEKMRKNVGVLIDSARRETDGITKSVKGVRTHFGGMNEEMEEIFTAAEELSAAMRETEEAADRIKRCSDDIEGSARHIAERARDGTEWAKDIRERALFAKDTALEKSDAVRVHKKSIRDGLMKALNDAKLVEQISVLAESVVELSEQMNMLSLNAGIEAARTGRAGKEYTGMVEEIRNLAEQSKKYAENIQWAGDEVTAALVGLRKEAKRLLEFVDRDVFSGFHYFVRLADTYNSDAGEMNFLSSDFGTTSDELLASAGAISDFLGDIRGAAKRGSERTADIADKSVHAAARLSSMSDSFQEAEEAAGRLGEEMRRFTTGSV